MKKNTMREVISLEDVTEELVIEYLCTHPEFFQLHEDILESLHLPHPCGPAVSLIERQVELLRDKNQQLQTKLRDTVDIARENEGLFTATKKLTLAMLGCTHLVDVCRHLRDHLQSDFHIDVVQVGLKRRNPQLQALEHVFNMGPKCKDAVITDILKANKPTCKMLGKAQKEYLFRENYRQVNSSAVIPLGVQGRLGLLALGSRNRHHFHRDMDTLFLDYIGKIVTELLGK